MRLQNKSFPRMIHMEVGQDPSQLMHHRSLFFTRILLASNLKNDHTNAQLPSISILRSCQENFLQKSHNLRFDFVLQHIEKSNPRTSSPLAIFLTSLLSIFQLNFFLSFFQFFFRFFSLLSHAKSFDFLPKLCPYPIRGTPYKK